MFNRTKSEFSSKNSKIRTLKNIKKYPKFKIESGKPHCFLYRIRKINPEIKLNYQLELYQKKQRYSTSKDEELINENKYNRKFFIRKKEDEDYIYQPALSHRDRIKRIYLQGKKSISTGHFRSIASNFKNGNNNYNFIDFSSIIDGKDLEDNNLSSFFITNNKKISTKYTTKTNSAETSRIFSLRNSPENRKDKQSLTKREKILYFKLKGLELRNKIYETFYRANNASLELNQEISNCRNYDKMFPLNDDEKYFKKNYRKINDDKVKLKENMMKCIEMKKSINPLPRNFQYLDKYGKRILMQARELDLYNQKFLHKNQDKKNFVLNSKFFINKLFGELNELGSDILATKKKFKGEDAIEPKNENNFFHGLIRENLLKNLSDDDYIQETMRMKNVENSLENKGEKRIYALKQRSKAIRHKVRSGDYNYL